MVIELTLKVPEREKKEPAPPGGWVKGLHERPLIDAVNGRLRWELRAILRGAAAVLRRIRSAGGDVLGQRVHLGKLERTGVLLAGLCRRSAPQFTAVRA